MQNLIVTPDVRTLPDGTKLYDLAASWQLPRGMAAKQIKVEYRRVDSREFTVHAIYDGTATRSVIASVEPSGEYRVRVTCYNDLGLGAGSVEQTVNITAGSITPAAVTGFEIVQDPANSSVLRLKWDANWERDILGYQLYNKDDETGLPVTELIAGTSYTYFIANSGTYTFTICAISRSGAESDAVEASITATVDAKSVAVPDPPHSGEITMKKGELLAVWDAVTNTYIDFYEVRMDDNVGQKAGLLAKTADIRAAITLENRSGAILVYGHNPQKGYGAPLSVHYDFPALPAPSIAIQEGMQGFAVILYDLTDAAKFYRVYIIGSSYNEALETTGALVSYTGEADIYQVYAVQVDGFGEGEPSETKEVVIKAKIDKEAIENLNVTQSDLDAVLAKQLQDIQTDAASAKQTAGAAQTTAYDASAAAGEAQTTANNASMAAGRAQTTAYNAKQTAGAAQTSANNANTAAGVAQTTANTANTAAGVAQSAASNAGRTARDATQSARWAQITADAANTSAGEAQTTANNANAAAGNAAKAAGEAQKTANRASSEAEGARSDAINSRDLAGRAKYAANEAQNKANEAQRTADRMVVQVRQTQDSISSIVAKLSGDPQNSGYSAITQIYNGLQLKVNQGDVVSAINVAPWGVRIDGRLLHITGNTQFDGNIIANHMLQANAVTADKLAVGSLSAISANIGLLRTKTAGERVEMENNQIRVYDANNKLRVRMGVW